ncbi:hypothetical protein ACJRO7_034751 [Eucalyptus globulus]|uniref:Uncharacterized protein n=1 Tax=Eucalyptus globulus TaxID=34317 RepID=A0ABD3J736_EUCGL
MSTATPLYEQPPPTPVTAQAYTSHAGRGSVGPVIAVLAVITVLGVIAGMIGRLCSGRPIMGHGQYDFEGWIERKCSACLDGRVDPPPQRPAVGAAAAVGAGAEEAAQEEAVEEIKVEEEEEEEELEEPQLQRRQHGHGTS